MVELSMFEVAVKRLLFALVVLLSFASYPCFAGTYEEADVAYEAGDYEKAKGILLPLAKSGHAKAMNLIGLMHDYGKGFSKDIKLACDWYEKSAELGYVTAFGNFSDCFVQGVGRDKDLAEAEKWCDLALENGSFNCAIRYLVIYADTDRGFAAKWGQKASDHGSKIARMAMKINDIPYDGPPPTLSDYFCELVWGPLMDKPQSYCDKN